jgi:hypothetical protein
MGRNACSDAMEKKSISFLRLKVNLDYSVAYLAAYNVATGRK